MYMYLYIDIYIYIYIYIHIYIYTYIYIYIYCTYKSKSYHISVPESHLQIHLQVAKSKRVDGSVFRAEPVLHTAKFENARGRIRNTGIFRRIVRVKSFASNCFDKMQNGLEIIEKHSAAYDVCQV